LTARLLGARKANLGRTQVVDEQRFRGRIVNHHLLAVEQKLQLGCRRHFVPLSLESRALLSSLEFERNKSCAAISPAGLPMWLATNLCGPLSGWSVFEKKHRD
jgi:hypothetical protein